MKSILLYFRAIFFAIFVAFHTLFCSVLVFGCLLLGGARSWADWLISTFWCGPMMKLSGHKVHLKGVDNVPKETGFLYLFTHSSHMDIPTLFYVTPKSFRFGAKISLFKIPIFGAAIRIAGTLPITREDRSKVMEVYKQAEKRVANGEAFALAPEGTRRQGTELLPFKSGPFIFAINAKMPIVPVVLCGLEGSLKKGSILVNTDQWIRDVGVHFLPAIETKDIPLEDMKKLKAHVRELMVNEYEGMKKDYLK